MTPSFLERAIVSLCCLGYLVLIVRCVRKLAFQRSVAAAFFTFATASNLMSLLYWVVYDFLRPNVRMPFAANEFGEIGGYLLLASALNAMFQGRFAAARKQIVCTAFFAAASVALWIAWSGEWLEDILTGLSFGYLLCVCVRSLQQSVVFSQRDWRLLGGGVALLLLLQGLTFALPVPWRQAADYGAYGVMFAIIVWGAWRLIRMLRRSGDCAAKFAMAASCWAWTTSTMYMSSGVLYMAALLGNMFFSALMLAALRRGEEGL